MESMNPELNKAKNEIKDLRLEITKLQNSDRLSDYFNKSHQSITNSDDLESVETISISDKVSAVCFLSILMNCQTIIEGLYISDFNVW